MHREQPQKFRAAVKFIDKNNLNYATIYGDVSTESELEEFVSEYGVFLWPGKLKADMARGRSQTYITRTDFHDV